ncbi:MAG: glutamate--tRNA ligase [Elusimicrobia bacterium]|nr:glutamate--tRNA ligase [Elusimicrobiota bacterium]
MVRVRFAPSPTGVLHVGGARTALFNWLFARNNKGTFILRIEDTDEVRSTDESVGQILESLAWLGLDWDEGPYFQMQRKEIYQKHLAQLEAQGKAYRCYCPPEELETMRRLALLEKRPPRYDGRCRSLTDTQRQEREAKGSPEGQSCAKSQGQKHVLRFAMPQEGETRISDLIRGQVCFENLLQQDLVIQKTSGIPTYNFACVIDDHLMGITHVIRGEEHLSNTPSQIQIYKALGWEPPQFAHLSMILGPDSAKLSKRHGAASVMDYKNQGYLPQTLRNYLALLGWATPTSQDLFEPEELIAKFNLDYCQKNPAVFDFNKLSWMNGIYIRKLSKSELFQAVKPYLPPKSDYDESKLEEMVGLEQEKYKTLADAGRLLDFFFDENYPYQWPDMEGLLAKSPNMKTAGDCLKLAQTLETKFNASDNFSSQAVEKTLRETTQEYKWKTSEVFHSLRFAISGRLQGPSLFHMAESLGKARVIQRLKRFHPDPGTSPDGSPALLGGAPSTTGFKGNSPRLNPYFLSPGHG